MKKCSATLKFKIIFKLIFAALLMSHYYHCFFNKIRLNNRDHKIYFLCNFNI